MALKRSEAIQAARVVLFCGIARCMRAANR